MFKILSYLESFQGLIGVIIGSVVTFLGQITYQIILENRKDKRQKEIDDSENQRAKHIAYNTFLNTDGRSNPLIYSFYHNKPNDFDWSIYYQDNRHILYQNLHLFSNDIVQSVLEMDSINEEMLATEEDLDGHYGARLYYLYSKIKSKIIEDYKEDINE